MKYGHITYVKGSLIPVGDLIGPDHPINPPLSCPKNSHAYKMYKRIARCGIDCTRPANKTKNKEHLCHIAFEELGSIDSPKIRRAFDRAMQKI